MAMDEKLLEILACPWCVTRPESPPAGVEKGALEVVGDKAHPTGLKCRQCRRLYKVEDGIPNLLVEEAVLEDAEA